MKFAKDFQIKLFRLLAGLAALLIGSLFLDRYIFTTLYISPTLGYGLGAFLFIGGMSLPAIAGRQLRIYGRLNHANLPRGTTDQMVVQGLYSVLRHPFFQGFWLITFGLGLLIRSPGFVLIAAPAANFYILWFALIKEEREGFDKFGCDYERYRRRVPAFLPRFLFTWTMKAKFNQCDENE